MSDTTPEIEQPDGVTDEEWNALGDPGKRALVRERGRATKAEADLAALRKAEADRAKTPPQQEQKTQQQTAGAKPEQQDIATIVATAVAEAMKPYQERDSRAALADAVTKAAKSRLQDPTDALAYLKSDDLVDSDGQPDEQRIAEKIDDLLKSKPYLAAATDGRRRAAPGAMLGGTSSTQTAEEKAARVLQRMQTATGIKLAKTD